MRTWSLILLLAALAAVVAGCADAGDPGDVVEDYLKARVAGDADGMRALTCAAREGEVDGLAISFANVEANADAVSCTKRDDTSVTCEGDIVAVYDGENTSIAVGAYAVVKEDGEWKVCGETE